MYCSILHSVFLLSVLIRADSIELNFAFNLACRHIISLTSAFYNHLTSLAREVNGLLYKIPSSIRERHLILFFNFSDELIKLFAYRLRREYSHFPLRSHYPSEKRLANLYGNTRAVCIFVELIYLRFLAEFI